MLNKNQHIFIWYYHSFNLFIPYPLEYRVWLGFHDLLPSLGFLSNLFLALPNTDFLKETGYSLLKDQLSTPTH